MVLRRHTAYTPEFERFFGRMAHKPDWLAGGVEFELLGDFLNGQ